MEVCASTMVAVSALLIVAAFSPLLYSERDRSEFLGNSPWTTILWHIAISGILLSLSFVFNTVEKHLRNVKATLNHDPPG